MMKNKSALFFGLVLGLVGLAVQSDAAVGDLVRITDDTLVSTTESVGMSYAKQSSVAYLENGNYVVVWDDWCNVDDNCPNDSDLDGFYFQLFNQNGEKIGGAVDTGMTSGYGKTTGVAQVDGGFVVSSQNEYRIFSSAGAPQTEVLNYVNAPNSGWWHDWFALKSSLGGGFAVASRYGGNIPFLETYDELGVSTGLVELSGSATERPNFITLVDNSGYLTIFSINDEIYGQFVSASLELSGAPFRIDQSDSPMLGQNGPYELIQNSNGDILVSWYDARIQQDRSYPDKIYGRLMRADGTFLTDEFAIASDLIEPSFIGQQGSNIYIYVPPAMAALGEKFIVAWMEKDGVSQANLAAHAKGIIVDGSGNLEGSVFKMETNEETVNPTRRALQAVLASNGTDNLALTWFDGRNSYADGNGQDPGTEIMVNFWEIESAPVTGLNAPDDLEAEAESESEIKLTWDDNSSNEEGFQIQRKKDGGSYKTIHTNDANDTSYTDDDLDPNTEYTYRVRAYLNDTYSDYSDSDSAKTQDVELKITDIDETCTTLKVTVDAGDEYDDNKEDITLKVRSTASGNEYEETYQDTLLDGDGRATLTFGGLKSSTEFEVRAQLDDGDWSDRETAKTDYCQAAATPAPVVTTPTTPAPVVETPVSQPEEPKQVQPAPQKPAIPVEQPAIELQPEEPAQPWYTSILFLGTLITLVIFGVIWLIFLLMRGGKPA